MSAEIEKKDCEISGIERVVIQGDLAQLSPDQRVLYYQRVCESMGLNPLTKPFAYIQLQNKLTLYATKDCTEQLRKINGISIIGIESQIIDDLFIVKVKAKDKWGRTDESTGAVCIANLRGESKANAIMKAETKGKRRVTLSISGLGWVDECEVESIPNAQTIPVNMETGEINKDTKNLTDSSQIPRPKKEETLSQEQFIEISTKLKNDEKLSKAILNRFMIEDLKDIPKNYYDTVMGYILKVQSKDTDAS